MKKNKKDTFTIFGLPISSNNLFALILIVIIGIIMLSRTLYINKKLTGDTEIVVAEVIDVYKANHGQRLWGYEMKYKYKHLGSEIIRNTAIQKNEMEKIKIGDCIEIVISLEDSNVQKWNKLKGAFKCQ